MRELRGGRFRLDSSLGAPEKEAEGAIASLLMASRTDAVITTSTFIKQSPRACACPSAPSISNQGLGKFVQTNTWITPCLSTVLSDIHASH